MTDNTVRPLSKSQYTRGLQCAKSLWLYRSKPELQDPVSPQDQAIFDQGTEVGILAQQRFPGGVMINADHRNPEAALEDTAVAIAAGARALYEAAFLHDGVLVRVDILVKNVIGNWDIYEVKSTTKVEDTHLDDAAIQRYVVTGSGLQVGRTNVVHIDPSYVRAGPVSLVHLFRIEDVTTQTEGLLDLIPGQLAKMKAMAAAPEPPAIEIGPRCTKPHGCSFQGHCWAHVPDYSVFNLANARMEKTTELWNDGVKTIAEIDTKKTKLTAYQTVQREAAKTNAAQINPAEIKKLLDGLVYPVYGLDFEAVNPAIPQYNGMRPYQPLAFEASIHYRAKRGGKTEHVEFLADGTRDPRPGLVQFLKNNLGTSGSVIAYNASYEGGILKGLAALENDDPQLLGAEQRLWDLAAIFRKAFWHEPSFEGSWSIKRVLPALVPDMSYDDMAIAEGTAAMRAYTRLMTDGTLSTEQRAQIMADLRAYCGKDSLAMLRILDRVEETVGVAA